LHSEINLYSSGLTARIVKKLGKHPEPKRRKRYRARKKLASESLTKKNPNMNIFTASAAAKKWQSNVNRAIDKNKEASTSTAPPRYMTFVKTEYNETPFYLDSLDPQHPPSPVNSKERIEYDETQPPFLDTIDDILDSASFREILERQIEVEPSLPDVHSSRFLVHKESKANILGPKFRQVLHNKKKSNNNKVPVKYERIEDSQPNPKKKETIFPKRKVSVHPAPPPNHGPAIDANPAKIQGPAPVVTPQIESSVKREMDALLMAKPHEIPPVNEPQQPHNQVKPDLSETAIVRSSSVKIHADLNVETDNKKPVHKRTKKKSIKYTSPRVSPAPKVPLHVYHKEKHHHQRKHGKHLSPHGAHSTQSDLEIQKSFSRTSVDSKTQGIL